jgi:hypothetical protein
MGAWFMGNMIHNSLTSTGAFEVFYDGQLVRSSTRRSPSSVPDRPAVCMALGPAEWRCLLCQPGGGGCLF